MRFRPRNDLERVKTATDHRPFDREGWDMRFYKNFGGRNANKKKWIGKRTFIFNIPVLD